MNVLQMQNPAALASLGYQNPRIIEKLMVDLDLKIDTATNLFDDTKRFLYLCHKYPEGLQPTRQIDEGWHVMLLFTREYDNYCRTFFGRFIHHAPSVPSDRTEAMPGSVHRLRSLARAEFGDKLSGNWGGKFAEVANCCSGGNCSNTGNCSHCTEG